MKLGFTVVKSLDEAMYEVVITAIKLVLPKTTNNGTVYVESDKVLTEQLLQDMVAKKAGYIDIEFTTQTDPVRKDSLRVWPQRLVWTLVQLADKAGIEQMEDTQELIGKKVKLYFSHSYSVATKNLDGTTGITKKLQKQWNLYEPTTVEVPVNDKEDEAPLNI